ncbi:MAG: DUF4837 family protein [Prevotella sp.]|nr:DUF4837 family protein [Prevotella sp.]
MNAKCLFGLIILILTACNEGSPLQPRSGGRPYEVLLVNDTDGIVYRELDADMEGLPQSEPSFDISPIARGQFTKTAKLARNIVMVDIDGRKYSQTRIRYEKDRYARPQMIAYINSPSAGDMEKTMLQNGGKMLRDLLTRAEINRRIRQLEEAHQLKAERIIRQMFGIDMRIPVELTAMKKAKNFVWLSNNSVAGMQNLCVFTVPLHGNDTDMIDSVLHKNIKGETDMMFMRVANKSLKWHRSMERGQVVTIGRGLWEMRGDAMGGPMVVRMLHGKSTKTFILTFVYAPESKKRNTTRALEASLYTIKPHKADKRKETQKSPKEA